MASFPPQALSTASEENGQAFEGPQEQRFFVFSKKNTFFFGSHIFSQVLVVTFLLEGEEETS